MKKVEPKVQESSPQNLIHELFEVEVATLDDVLFLGSENIGAMIGAWRYGASQLSKQIVGFQGMLNALKGINLIASKAEVPDLSYVEMIEIGNKRYEVPADLASLQREKGVTTFGICGWCHYADLDQRVNDCFVEGNCYILWKISHSEETPTVTYKTPCLLLSQAEKVAEGLQGKIDETRQEKAKHDAAIKQLLVLKRRAVSKPGFVDHRKTPDSGERVVSFREYAEESGWYLGTAMGAGRVYFDKPVSEEGGFQHIGYMCNNPYDLKLSDFKYLADNPDFARLWAMEDLKDSSLVNIFLERLAQGAEDLLWQSD